jgi:eukaryotic-like serine/threonine-protein kinase
MTGQVSIFDLLAKWESAQHRGEEISLEKLCAEAPQLLTELKEKVSALNSMARMVETLDTQDDVTKRSVNGAADGGNARGWSEAPISTQSRYQFVKWHAKGGLGEVLVAHDTTLGRDVAIKVVKAAYENDERCRRRFLKEAEVTGRLEHPGVAPVYGLGGSEEGHPCYAMRFIEGETLADAATRFHQEHKGQTKADGHFQLRQLLSRFVSVCNTIAYAHSRDVVHRDLKPANILLGKYGETFVIDWGLAKTLKQNSEGSDEGATLSDDGPISGLDNPPNNDGPALTQHNDIVGTPVYMSPEQAQPGESVGKAADIYGLGATLYFVLTGQPPVQDVSLGKIIDKVREGRIAKPSSVSSAPDAKLEAICLKALAKRPADRYAFAEGLADDLEHWLADEPVSALEDSLGERASRLARRHRGVTLAGVIGVLIVAVVSSVFAVLLNWQTNIARTQKAAAEQLATQKAELAQKESEARRIAGEQSQLALATLKGVVRDIQRDLSGVSGAVEVRRELLNKALAGLEKVAKSVELQAEVDRHRMIALNDIGGIYLIAGSVTGKDATQEALRFFTIAKDLAQKLAATDRGYEAHRDCSVALEKIGETQMQLGELGKAEEAYRKSLEISEKSAALAPDSSAAARDMAFGFEKVGDICLARESVNDAAKAYDRSRELFVSALARNPSDVLLQRDLAVSLTKLGNILLQNGDPAGAAKTYGESVSQLRALTGAEKSPASKRDLSVGLNKLGAARQAEKSFEEAAKAFTESLQLAKEYLAEEPGNLQRQRDVTVSLNNLGDLAIAKQDLEGAKGYLAESLAARRKILEQSPTSFGANFDTAYVLVKLSELDVLLKDDIAKKAHLTEAQAILKPLYDSGKLQSAAGKQMYDSVKAGLKE